MNYNWQQKDWTQFSYNIKELEDKLYLFEKKTGQVQGITKGLSKTSHTQTTINILVSEAIKSSEIEGEYLSRKDVMSSVRNNLKINTSTENVKDIKAKGIGELVTSVQNTFKDTLTKEMLFDWHRKLLQHNKNIKVGEWRTHHEPMQVISGAMGREKIHFQAPDSKNLPKEMKLFITWFNDSAPKGKRPIKHAAIRAAIAHLYFESIHPFEDGNGRIGRAIAEKALLQTIDSPLLISLSTSIEKEKKQYYESLEIGQRNNQITNWLHYFIDIILNALDVSEAIIDFTLKKTILFDTYKSKMNDRQLKVIKRMLAEGIDGFEGGITAKKYIGITKTSKATATRDLQNLLEIGVLELLGKGRNTSYQINFNNI
jgi:Fic family protein